MVLWDLHRSHLFNVKYMQWMKEHNIKVCCFLPHCTHILQPLDDVPYATLKKRYQKELMAYNFKITGAHMTRTQFFCVLVPAFTQAFTPENIRKGFENTGIYPINPNANKVQETGPSAVTNKCKLRVPIGPLMLFNLLLFQIFVGSLNSFLVSVFWLDTASRSQEAYPASGSCTLINFSLLLQMPRPLPRFHRMVRVVNNQNNIKKTRGPAWGTGRRDCWW